VLLRQDVFAHSSGLGEAYAAYRGGIPSLAYNPAGLLGMSRYQACASYSSKLIDTNIGFAGAGYGNRSFAVAVGCAYVDAGKEQFNFSDGPSRSVTALQENVLMLGVAKSILKKITIGVGAKNYSTSLAEQYTASSIAFDAGVQYEGPVEGLALGASVRNAGGSLSYVHDRESLPQQVRVGGMYAFTILRKSSFFDDTPPVMIRVLADALQTTDEESSLHLGASIEAGYAAFSVGYKSGLSNENISFGARAKGGKNITLSYAFVPRRDFDAAHTLTLGVNW
jgi:hypothetical protein